MFQCEECKHIFEQPVIISHYEDTGTDWEEELIDRRECPKCTSTKLSYHEIP